MSDFETVEDVRPERRLARQVRAEVFQPRKVRGGSRTPQRATHRGRCMTALERMARAIYREDVKRFLPELDAKESLTADRSPPASYMAVAKAALAALLPLDEDAIDVARKATMRAGQSGHLSATPITDVVARAAIAAYLKHIGGEG